MRIYMTELEKVGGLLVFLAAIAMGLIMFFDDISFEDIVPAIATLIAAFAGAWTAFLLDIRARKEEKREQQLDAANKLIFALYERLNTLKLFQVDFIDPTRGSAAQELEMKPVSDFRTPSSDLNAQEVAFIIQTKYKQLMLDINIANESFNEAVRVIRHRSHLHLNVFQPLIESAGFTAGQGVSNKEVVAAIGERNHALLKQTTDGTVYLVDKFIERGDALRENLVAAFSDIFSNEEVLNFVLLDSSEMSRDRGE